MGAWVHTLRNGQARVREFLPDALVERINRPLGEATCLPNAAYTSQAFFELEQRYLFRRTWVVAGYAHEVSEPGDMMPTDVAGIPLLLIRDEKKQIRVFQNVCRHRGARLVDAPCSRKQAVVCPYHSWTYALDGRLQRRPHFFGGDKHDVASDEQHQAGLIPVRAEVWHHWILVNIDANAPPLTEHLKFLDDKLEGYDVAAAAHAGTLTFDIDTNWKFAHENFIEPYHVFSAHPRLHDFVPMCDRHASDVEGHVMWNDYQFKSAEEGRGLGLPHFPALSTEQSMRGIWFTVFPSFGIEIYPDHIAMFHVNPIAPARSREKIAVYLVGEAATATQYESGRQSVLDMWRDLNAEDIGLLESLQRGRQAPGYDGGVLSPYWDEAPRSFSRLVAETMRAESARADPNSTE
jgi:choline monooxygenase